MLACQLFDIGKTTLIDAHETELACLALSPGGGRVATASEKVLQIDVPVLVVPVFVL
jgi:hypothetical protein